MLYQEDETETLRFCSFTPDGVRLDQENRFEYIELILADRVVPWLENNPGQLVAGLAEKEGLELADCSQRYTGLRLPEGKGWYYQPLLGVYGEFG